MKNELFISTGRYSQKCVEFTDITGLIVKGGVIQIKVNEVNNTKWWYMITKNKNDCVILNGTKYSDLYNKENYDKFTVAVERFRTNNAIEKL